MRLRSCLLALAIPIAFAAGVVFWAGDHLTAPARLETGVPDVALGAHALRFASGSGVELSAWFVPGSANAGAVLLLHGVRSNKRAMLPRARFLHALGFSLLLVDLQAHGESGGERIAFGRREAADVSAALRKLKALAPGERLGVLGTSLGAAAFVFSDAQPLVDAAVLESLYPTIEEAIANRLRIRFGTMGSWLAPLLLAQLDPRLGVTPAQLRPIDRVGLLQCPVLLVHGSEDRHTTLDEAERIYARIRAPKALHVVNGAAHSDVHARGGRAYERRVGEFLVRYLRGAGHDTPM